MSLKHLGRKSPCKRGFSPFIIAVASYRSLSQATILNSGFFITRTLSFNKIMLTSFTASLALLTYPYLGIHPSVLLCTVDYLYLFIVFTWFNTDKLSNATGSRIVAYGSTTAGSLFASRGTNRRIFKTCLTAFHALAFLQGFSDILL